MENDFDELDEATLFLCRAQVNLAVIEGTMYDSELLDIRRSISDAFRRIVALRKIQFDLDRVELTPVHH